MLLGLCRPLPVRLESVSVGDTTVGRSLRARFHSRRAFRVLKHRFALAWDRSSHGRRHRSKATPGHNGLLARLAVLVIRRGMTYQGYSSAGSLLRPSLANSSIGSVRIALAPHQPKVDIGFTRAECYVENSGKRAECRPAELFPRVAFEMMTRLLKRSQDHLHSRRWAACMR